MFPSLMIVLPTFHVILELSGKLATGQKKEILEPLGTDLGFRMKMGGPEEAETVTLSWKIFCVHVPQSKD